mgnify:FL=1
MKVLLTGASGFLGAHFAAALLRAGHTVRASLRATSYPAALRRVVVIADNCSDATAARARAAGADVWERIDPDVRGKGHALAFAFERVLAGESADAVVVVDADTTVAPDLLLAFDAALAAGHEALQADYGVRNAADSWRTRLTALALAIFHDTRSAGRERLALSSGLRGNGMCFRTALLRRVPHQAFSIVEDLEYGIQLGLAGVRVAHVGEARVLGEMPATGATARSQRERWERGRRAMRRRHALPLLAAARRRRDPVLLDLALDLLVPPLSRLVAAVALGWTLAAAALTLGAPAGPALALWSVAAAALLSYVVRGCMLTGNPLRAAADLAWAPPYMLWKLTVSSRPAAHDAAWVRTSRAGATPGGR